MKNLYITNKKQIDKNKLYTRFSGWVKTHCANIKPLLEPYVNKMCTSFEFDNDYYDSLDYQAKSFYGDSVDSLLSGGSYGKVNGYRKYFHQPLIEPDEQMKKSIEKTDEEILKWLQVYQYSYPRWKSVYYPDGKYRTHLDLIVAGMFKDSEVFDLTIAKTDDELMSKLIELIGLTNFNSFEFVNVLNLYTGTWLSVCSKLPDSIKQKCKDLFNEFVKHRTNEERSNVYE